MIHKIFSFETEFITGGWITRDYKLRSNNLGQTYSQYKLPLSFSFKPHVAFRGINNKNLLH